ncbi:MULTISPECIES: hypothetical protein [unclassified Clostridium]|jgi:hypothetical protein|uniref:hypothetical protein n=1 Tax=unclassified Clostridium TaxID=2614128 RepID=UPI0025BB856A|nr:hypothetical protein [Clostridium sp.]MCI6692470.1 hypothetical protein [Clostridium sp.]MDY2631926.1 hypothetical protein [Clostridium sp.]MDY4251099.1 hypothetical protein [Clostridium sp.]MDY6227907.1 hypothetical protein [Clostridium sp.]
MKSFKISRNTSVLIMIFVLFVSLLINVYTSIMNSRYKILIGKETYKSIEEIRNRNESSLATLDQCIKAKSVSNEELLSLYKNYSSISKEFTNLWVNYKEYGKEDIISINRKSKISNEVPTEVYSRVESLLFEQLNYEMKTNKEKVILEGEVLDNFTAMNNMTNEINNFFKEFNENKLKNTDIDKREIIYIKNSYWIDVLKGMNSIIDSYSNYEFTFKE